MATFRCWFAADNEGEDASTIDASGAQQAAETFACDTNDGLSDYVDVCVREDDGTVSTWTVAIETRTTYAARRAARHV